MHVDVDNNPADACSRRGSATKILRFGWKRVRRRFSLVRKTNSDVLGELHVWAKSLFRISFSPHGFERVSVSRVLFAGSFLIK